MDHMIEFWLSGTFGVIVARFIGGKALTRPVVRLMAFLYMAATALAFLRYFLIAGRAGFYVQALATAGYGPFPADPVLARGMSTAFLVLTVGGTCATLYFLLWHKPLGATGSFESGSTAA